MANKPFSTTNPTHPTRLPMPMAAKVFTKPDPGVEPTIRGMISDDGDSAGAEDQSAPAATSNGVLGAYRSAIVAPPGYRVP